jgi:hypothetical protein
MTVAARSKAQNVFTCPNNGIVGSIPTRSMDVCPGIFCFCVVLYRQLSCDRAVPPSKVSYRLCKIHTSGLILIGKRPAGLISQGRRKRRRNRLSGQNVEFRNVKVGVNYHYNCPLNGHSLWDI